MRGRKSLACWRRKAELAFLVEEGGDHYRRGSLGRGLEFWRAQTTIQCCEEDAEEAAIRQYILRCTSEHVLKWRGWCQNKMFKKGQKHRLLLQYIKWRRQAHCIAQRSAVVILEPELKHNPKSNRIPNPTLKWKILCLLCCNGTEAIE